MTNRINEIQFKKNWKLISLVQLPKDVGTKLDNLYFDTKFSTKTHKEAKKVNQYREKLPIMDWYTFQWSFKFEGKSVNITLSSVIPRQGLTSFRLGQFWKFGNMILYVAVLFTKAFKD